MRRAEEFGIQVEVTKADFADAMAYKERAVQAVEAAALSTPSYMGKVEGEAR